ncbi:uncharacterized protein LDX57_000295 [Aspergillus melleus]|uniref:uncharacterized protein n=1 Tax=Aspergillus melleus TaxID=138277 RepID=UPI001E8D0B17|nr:uncharacterized protein LDX57_000295 [Aspergillus melleus]KAH8422541.1 hypothetical protein LDX57_000295 [Aspergillus melleus]
MSSQIEALPYEIRQFILEYLDATSPASLTALGCASKQLFDAVKPFLFRTIRFSVKDFRDYYSLKQDRISTAVQEFSKLLQRYNGTEHVQNLILGGDMIHHEYHPRGSSTRGDLGPYHWRQSKISHDDRIAIASADGEPCDEPTACGYSFASGSQFEDCHTDDHVWKPLAEFIKTLPGLRHLIYQYFSQFPPCLLEALHHHRPGCKLHLYSFNMRSASDELGAYETKLLTSPCVRSINSWCQGFIEPGQDNQIVLSHPGDFLMCHAVVTAPALKRVQVDILPVRGGARRAGYSQKGPKIVAAHENILTSLHSLRLHRRYAKITRDILERWTKHADFSQLKVLGIIGSIVTEALEYLGSNCNFPSLQSLFLDLSLDYADDLSEFDNDAYQEDMVHFLCRVPPLLSLSLSHMPRGMDVERVAQHHGSRIRRLTITKYPLKEHDLKCLAKYCLRLEYLKLSLERSFGDANELALYSALGSIPRLVEIELDLYTPDRHTRNETHPEHSEGDSYDEFHEQNCTLWKYGKAEYIKNGYLRDTFMNCALDKDLACSIFRAISAGKPQNISRSIRRLSLNMTGGRIIGRHDEFNDNCITQLVIKVSGRWKIERNPRHDQQNDLIATNLDPGSKKKMRSHNNPSRSNVEEVLSRLWPGVQDMSDWENHWHSFPLAEVDKEAEN